MSLYLVRLAQVHESFRQTELQALADIAGIKLTFVRYNEDSPYCIVRLHNDEAAKTLVARSLLAQGIYELWGEGITYPALHTSVRSLSTPKWPNYSTVSFRFTVEGYRGSRSPESQREIIDSFAYFGFTGPPRMKDPDVSFRVFESFDLGVDEPQIIYLGRLVAESNRNAMKRVYDLKKRHYISTTSMDAELALLTANIAHAAPGKLFYDPFMGTGGFPVACAHFGAIVCGSDIDGRTIRGTGGSARRGQTGKMDVIGNFAQYRLAEKYLGGFVSDLTNSPLRVPLLDNARYGVGGYLDGIICDPPYGIREGLKVLGSRSQLQPTERKTHEDQFKHPDYIPPKRPYSFTALLDDILVFAAATLVEDGRLSMWMPTANDEDVALIIPQHPYLELGSICVQTFNKWSRRLLTYRRRCEREVPEDAVLELAKKAYGKGTKADELNDFRRKYFEGFKEFESMKKEFVRMKVEAGTVMTRLVSHAAEEADDKNK